MREFGLLGSSLAFDLWFLWRFQTLQRLLGIMGSMVELLNYDSRYITTATIELHGRRTGAVVLQIEGLSVGLGAGFPRHGRCVAAVRFVLLCSRITPVRGSTENSSTAVVLLWSCMSRGYSLVGRLSVCPEDSYNMGSFLLSCLR